MVRRLALLTLIAALPACERGEQRAAAEPAVPAPEVAVLSPKQLQERAASCRERGRSEARADRHASAGQAPEGLIAIGYAPHYNAKLDTCFLLRSASFPAAAGGALRRTLVDADERERYGEYLGPADGGAPGQRQPETCNVMSMYCASEHEWEVLAGNFMVD
jgi:hypothetical protein